MSANRVSADEKSLKSDLRELVRKTMQETLNALLDEEADEMVGAERHERTAAREAYRSGHYRVSWSPRAAGSCSTSPNFTAPPCCGCAGYRA